MISLNKSLGNSAIVDKIHQITSGRPLFVLQLASLIVQTGGLDEVLKMDIKSSTPAKNFLYDRILEYLSKNARNMFLGIGLLADKKDLTGLINNLKYILNLEDKEDVFENALQELVKLKIITIEDPVEKEIPGVDQIQVNNEIGLTFDSILRRVLRQDPDVILIGEIRDKETAELAVRAALTGHLILSTLHTNDSFSAITRLKNLGIDSYLISGVLKICLAQRLVRKICKSCKGEGCEECNNTGYKGRTAATEIFEIDEVLAKMIEQNVGETEMKSYSLKKGFIPLVKDAKNKVNLGITTDTELLREGIV